jgi:hypothetical protein
MRSHCVIGIMITAALLSGCTGKLEKQVHEHEERVDALSEQVASLERATRALQAALEDQSAADGPGAVVSTSNLVVNAYAESGLSESRSGRGRGRR